MSGVKGRSGRKPKSIAARALHNIAFRPPNVLTMPAPESLPGAGLDEGWSPSRQDLFGLYRGGMALVSQWREAHVMNLQEGTILLAAARCRDAADRWHKRARAKGPAQARFCRLALQYERQFALLLGQLRVRALAGFRRSPASSTAESACTTSIAFMTEHLSTDANPTDRDDLFPLGHSRPRSLASFVMSPAGAS